VRTCFARQAGRGARFSSASVMDGARRTRELRRPLLQRDEGVSLECRPLAVTGAHGGGLLACGRAAIPQCVGEVATDQAHDERYDRAPPWRHDGDTLGAVPAALVGVGRRRPMEHDPHPTPQPFGCR
jgi:hypothetical protein